MNNIFYVYHLIDPNTNTPFYVGKGCNIRIFDHIKSTKSKRLYKINKYLFYKIRKLLKNGRNIIYKKIIENVDESTAFCVELDEIKKYGRKNNNTGILCNMTDGGEGTSGHCLTNETKTLMSKKRIEFLKNNPSIKQNMVITIKNLSDFCRKNNLNISKMWKLMHGQKNEYKNYKNIDYFANGMKRKSNIKKIKIWHEINKKSFSEKMKSVYNVTSHQKCYKFVSPNGNIVDICNLRKFCLENKLSNSHMSCVNKGTELQHKGWKKYTIFIG
jgi:hypothetical protein